MTLGPRGSSLSVVVQSQSFTQTISVVYTTFDNLSDPCSYLVSQLSAYVREEAGAPASSSVTCSLVSSSILSDARREYRFLVTTAWTV